MELTLTVVVALAAAVSALYLALQTRLMNRAAELTFNLELMMRLDATFTAIAKDESLNGQFWAPSHPEHSIAGVKAQAVLDLLSMAAAAGMRFPGFHRYDWDAYTRFIIYRSPLALGLLVDHPDWWPELSRYLPTEGFGRRPSNG